jgi:hypothetical protein
MILVDVRASKSLCDDWMDNQRESAFGSGVLTSIPAELTSISFKPLPVPLRNCDLIAERSPAGPRIDPSANFRVPLAKNL